MLTRTLVIWYPDWPVVAACQENDTGDKPVAVFDRGRVLACSARARYDGVRRGQRLRDAQSRCPELVDLPYDPALDARAFEPVVGAIEAITPGVQLVRPGTCAIRVRGPSRYFGTERAAAEAILKRIRQHSSTGHGGNDDRVSTPRAGCADGTFAAEQAARATHADDPVRVIAAGESAGFLSTLPVDLLGQPELADLLRRLGLVTMGEFATLSSTDVLNRFGPIGAHAHRLAGGGDSRPVAARTPPPNLVRWVEFDDPADRVDQVAFGVRAAADHFVDDLAHEGLVCTSVRIEVVTEVGSGIERRWLHPRWFNAADLVDRVRWQLASYAGGSLRVSADQVDVSQDEGGANIGHIRDDTASTDHGAARRRLDAENRNKNLWRRTPVGQGTSDAGLTSPVVRVGFIPDEVDPIGAHADGLWGTGPDEKVHRALSRVQSMLGHGGVVSAVVGGGRGPGDRQTWVPWGDRPAPTWPVDAPWPGTLPAPAPTTVLPTPRPALVVTAEGQLVDVDERGVLTGIPASFCPDIERSDTGSGSAQPIDAWAGPWPVSERWWDETFARRLARFQVVGADGSAWLLIVSSGQWWTEARYD
jgi:protein ImuB